MILASVLAGAAWAQSPDPSRVAPLESITVTSSRSPSPLSDLPTSISIIEEVDFREQLTLTTNILSALDVLAPGLTVGQVEFRSGCRTNIRGRPAQFLVNCAGRPAPAFSA